MRKEIEKAFYKFEDAAGVLEDSLDKLMDEMFDYNEDKMSPTDITSLLEEVKDIRYLMDDIFENFENKSRKEYKNQR